MATKLEVFIADEPGTQSVSVPFQDDEPIFFLIERISDCLDEKCEEIERRDLYVGGIRLEDQQQTMATYRIFGNAVTYRAEKRQLKRFFVRDLTGRTYYVNYHEHDTIEDIKHRIQEFKHYSPDDLKLTFHGTVLENSRTVADYHLQDGSTIGLKIELRGGGYAPAIGISFSDVSDTKSVRKQRFSKSAPPGRIVEPGANIECQCECTPRYRVICPKGTGLIELSQAKFTCPNCHQHNKIVPVTVGFTKCKYRFHGIRNTGEQYTSEWKEVPPEDCYQLFSASNQTTWKRLVIETAKLNEREVCTMCLVPLTVAKKLDCGHGYHEACHAKWKSSCPICRFNQHLLIC
ncbi:hypothetical protein BGZ99_004848 [Dissophora globulifera]|uniref:Uncharacterized protein n=1 Tax=Dissophora globulifera TaxID=979702 RepID=A0A9P6RIQ0_9FUNG|nr:hypothetical protein BGZ99_004848 [Dissophora globulifera]